MSASALKAKKKSRQRIHRYTSNVFSMFSQSQIQEFKVRSEANRIGTINVYFWIFTAVSQNNKHTGDK